MSRRGGHLSVERGAEVNLLTSLHPYPPLTLLTSFRRKLVMCRKAPLPRDPSQPIQPSRGPEPQQPETTMESPPLNLETQPLSTSAVIPQGANTSARKRGGRTRGSRLKKSQGSLDPTPLENSVKQEIPFQPPEDQWLKANLCPSSRQ